MKISRFSFFCLSCLPSKVHSSITHVNHNTRGYFCFPDKCVLFNTSQDRRRLLTDVIYTRQCLSGQQTETSQTGLNSIGESVPWMIDKGVTFEEEKLGHCPIIGAFRDEL